MSCLSRLLKIGGCWLAAACLSVSAAGELQVGPAPAWVQWRDYQLDGGEENPSGLAWLFYDKQEQLRDGESFRHFAYRIVAQEGLADGAQIKLPFDPDYQSLVLHRVKVWRDGAARDYCAVDKFQVIQQERELDRQIYNGRRTALCFLADVRLGDVVEVAFTWRGWNPIYGGHYSQEFPASWGFPLREQQLRVIPRDGQRLYWRWQGPRPAAARAEPRQDGGAWRWRAESMPAVSAESQAPSWCAQHGYWQVSDFQSWAAVADWALPLYALPADGELLRQQAARLAQLPGSQEQRAVAAVDFVQKEVRYLGMEMGVGSHRPSPPELVLERRFGDCKDKALLLTALLRRLGVEAYPVLVNSDWRGRLDELLPGANAFDHVVTLIVINGQALLIDATAVYQAGQRLADRHMGLYGRGLVLRPGETQLTAFTPGERDLGGKEFNERLVVSDYQSPVEFNVVSTFRGADAEHNRMLFAGVPREDIEKSYREYYAQFYPGLSTAKPLELQDDRARNIVQIREYYRLDRFFAPVADGRHHRAEISTPYVSHSLPQLHAQGRRSPLALGVGYPRRLSVTTRVEFPDDWPMTGAGQKNIETPWFNYRYAERKDGRRVVVREQQLTIQAEQVPVAQLAEYTAKRAAIVDHSGMQFTRRTPNPNLSMNLSMNSSGDDGAAFVLGLLVLLGILAGIVSGVAIVGWLIYRRLRRQPPPPLPPPLPR
ncbi:MAG: DUF3857 domain-containing protein [Verrucomicrobiales bacterium]|jgi:hypothetical protein|nr:DUF3857 domain-containing protein [Verrucomicrobiales bacterium]